MLRIATRLNHAASTSTNKHKEKRCAASVLGPRRTDAVEIGLWQDKKECGLAVDTKEKDIPSPQVHAAGADHKGPRVSPASDSPARSVVLSSLRSASLHNRNDRPPSIRNPMLRTPESKTMNQEETPSKFRSLAKLCPPKFPSLVADFQPSNLFPSTPLPKLEPKSLAIARKAHEAFEDTEELVSNHSDNSVPTSGSDTPQPTTPRTPQMHFESPPRTCGEARRLELECKTQLQDLQAAYAATDMPDDAIQRSKELRAMIAALAVMQARMQDAPSNAPSDIVHKARELELLRCELQSLQDRLEDDNTTMSSFTDNHSTIQQRIQQLRRDEKALCRQLQAIYSPLPKRPKLQQAS